MIINPTIYLQIYKNLRQLFTQNLLCKLRIQCPKVIREFLALRLVCLLVGCTVGLSIIFTLHRLNLMRER
jgi:hypothetical protein